MSGSILPISDSLPVLNLDCKNTAVRAGLEPATPVTSCLSVDVGCNNLHSSQLLNLDNQISKLNDNCLTPRDTNSVKNFQFALNSLTPNKKQRNGSTSSLKAAPISPGSGISKHANSTSGRYHSQNRSQHVANHIPSDPQQICRVCEGKASGLHFGEYTCESCKLFFLRQTKQEKNSATGTTPGSTAVCPLSWNCDINHKVKSKCRACRFKKCCEVGMSKQRVVYGRNARAKPSPIAPHLPPPGPHSRGVHSQLQLQMQSHPNGICDSPMVPQPLQTPNGPSKLDNISPANGSPPGLSPSRCGPMSSQPGLGLLGSSGQLDSLANHRSPFHHGFSLHAMSGSGANNPFMTQQMLSNALNLSLYTSMQRSIQEQYTNSSLLNNGGMNGNLAHVTPNKHFNDGGANMYPQTPMGGHGGAAVYTPTSGSSAGSVASLHSPSHQSPPFNSPCSSSSPRSLHSSDYCKVAAAEAAAASHSSCAGGSDHGSMCSGGSSNGGSPHYVSNITWINNGTGRGGVENNMNSNGGVGYSLSHASGSSCSPQGSSSPSGSYTGSASGNSNHGGINDILGSSCPVNGGGSNYSGSGNDSCCSDASDHPPLEVLDWALLDDDGDFQTMGDSGNEAISNGNSSDNNSLPEQNSADLFIQHIAMKDFVKTSSANTDSNGSGNVNKTGLMTQQSHCGSSVAQSTSGVSSGNESSSGSPEVSNTGFLPTESYQQQGSHQTQFSTHPLNCDSGTTTVSELWLELPNLEYVCKYCFKSPCLCFGDPKY